METATLTTLITAQVRRLLPPEDVPEGDIPDIVRFLTEKYGEPELTPSGSDEEAMVFSLPDRKIKLQRSVSTRALLGFWILAQAAPTPPAAPCSVPGGPAALTTATGSGSVDFLFNPIAAFRAALVIAAGNLAVDVTTTAPTGVRAAICFVCTVAPQGSWTVV